MKNRVIYGFFKYCVLKSANTLTNTNKWKTQNWQNWKICPKSWYKSRLFSWMHHAIIKVTNWLTWSALGIIIMKSTDDNNEPTENVRYNNVVSRDWIEKSRSGKALFCSCSNKLGFENSFRYLLRLYLFGGEFKRGQRNF